MFFLADELKHKFTNEMNSLFLHHCTIGIDKPIFMYIQSVHFLPLGAHQYKHDGLTVLIEQSLVFCDCYIRVLQTRIDLYNFAGE